MLGLFATVLSSCIASAALSPLQIWKTRKQAYYYVQYMHIASENGIKKDQFDPEDQLPKPCFIDQFGWATMYIGITAEVLSWIPVTICIYYACNIWDEEKLAQKISNGVEFSNEFLYFIIVGIVSGIATSASDNKKVALQFYLPCKRYFTGITFGIAKQVLFWSLFISVFLYCLMLRNFFCENQPGGLKYLMCTSIWFSGMIAGLIAGFVSHPLDALSIQLIAKELQKLNGYFNLDLFTSEYLLDTHNFSRQDTPGNCALFSGLVGRLLHISLHFTVTLLWCNFLAKWQL